MLASTEGSLAKPWDAQRNLHITQHIELNRALHDRNRTATHFFPQFDFVAGETLQFVFEINGLDWIPGVKKHRIVQFLQRLGWRAADLRAVQAHLAVLWMCPDQEWCPSVLEGLIGDAGPGTLHLAAVDERATREMLRLGAGPVNAEMEFGEVWLSPFQFHAPETVPVSALHVAAGRGTVGSVSALLQAGADPGATTRHGDTPLHLACGLFVRPPQRNYPLPKDMYKMHFFERNPAVIPLLPDNDQPNVGRKTKRRQTAAHEVGRSEITNLRF